MIARFLNSEEQVSLIEPLILFLNFLRQIKFA
jgi:hypothetical protein